LSCECEVGFAVEAAKDGLFLSPGTAFDWIGTKGPFGLTGPTASVFEPVMAIAQALAADLEAMEFAKRVSRPRADLLHKESGVIIEVDELQHFTSHRLGTFESYPADAELGFDIDQYKELCVRHHVKADKAWGTKKTATFGPKSRGRQRAFYDALKDLSIPAAGLPPVVRVPVPDRDTARAWKASREGVFAAIELARKNGPNS
jgi:hypothetical protein